MTDLMSLNKRDLICKIQSTDRQKHRLKTLLSKHQMLTTFYEQLYDNCVEINDNNARHRSVSQLRSTQTRLLSQIKAIRKCDKSVAIPLTRHPTQDTLTDQLFTDKSTQWHVDDLLCPNIDSNHLIEPLINHCNGVNHSSNSLVDNTNTNTKCIEIDINETSCEGLSQTLQPMVDLTDKLMADSEPQNGGTEETADTMETKSSEAETKKLKKYVCDYCGKRYKGKKTRDKHITTVHRYITTETIKTIDTNLVDEPKPDPIEPMPELPQMEILTNQIPVIACQWPECGLTFINRTHFLRHQSIHNESRKVCSECGMRFEDPEQLRLHMIWHSNQIVNHLPVNSIESQMSMNSKGMTSDQMNGFEMNYNYNDLQWQSCNTNGLKLDSTRHYPRPDTINNRLLFCDFPNCQYKTSNHNHLDVHRKKAHEMIYMSL